MIKFRSSKVRCAWSASLLVGSEAPQEVGAGWLLVQLGQEVRHRRHLVDGAGELLRDDPVRLSDQRGARFPQASSQDDTGRPENARPTSHLGSLHGGRSVAGEQNRSGRKLLDLVGMDAKCIPASRSAVQQWMTSTWIGRPDPPRQTGFMTSGFCSDRTAGGRDGDLQAGARAKAGRGRRKDRLHEPLVTLNRRAVLPSVQGGATQKDRRHTEPSCRSTIPVLLRSAGRVRSTTHPGCRSTKVAANVSPLDCPVLSRRRCRASGVSLSATISFSGLCMVRGWGVNDDEQGPGRGIAIVCGR